MCIEKNVIKSMKGSWVCLSIVLLNAGTNIDCKHYCSTFFKRRAYTYTYLYIYICICINKTSTTITHHICAVSSLKLPLIFLFSPHLVSSLRCLLLFLCMQKHSKCVFGCGCVCVCCALWCTVASFHPVRYVNRHSSISFVDLMVVFWSMCSHLVSIQLKLSKIFRTNFCLIFTSRLLNEFRGRCWILGECKHTHIHTYISKFITHKLNQLRWPVTKYLSANIKIFKNNNETTPTTER